MISPDEEEFVEDKLTMDDFDLLKVLGKGSYGKVVQARHKRNCRIYAIKIIKKDGLQKVEIDNTKSECLVLRKLQHPYVVGLKASFQTRDKLYLLMDYIPGGDMYTFLKGRGVNEHLARFFIAELVLALEYVHDNGIVFRDLKTENILLDTDGNIRLTDFGLAKGLEVCLCIHVGCVEMIR